MTTTEKILIVFVFLIAIISIGAAYYRYMVIEDYEIFLEFDESGQLINLEE